MTPKQRVMAALNHQPPDRLPLFDGFWSEFARAWRHAHPEAGDQELTDYYGIDVAICVANEAAFPSRAGVLEDRGTEVIERDGWGRLLRRKKDAFFADELDSALHSRQEFDATSFEDPLDDSRYGAFVSQVAAQQENRCVFCKIGGPYLRTAFVRGQEDFLTDIAGDPAFARAQIERMAEHLKVIALESLRRADLYDTGVWIYDDMCNNNGPMMSPRQFETLFLPAYRDLVQSLKQAGAAKVILHCDGNLTPLLDMVLDAGADGVNPVEPKAGMDLVVLKERYGRRLSFLGGMCNARVLPKGTKEEIVAATERIKEAGRDGGVVIGTHSIGPDVPVEHYDWYHEAVRNLARPGRSDT